MPKDDAPLMPFLRELERSNLELQHAQHGGLDTEAMKQKLEKVTQDRLETLKAARTQLTDVQYKRLKRLLQPIAKNVEKVGGYREVLNLSCD